jgi:hypothetical protein
MRDLVGGMKTGEDLIDSRKTQTHDDVEIGRGEQRNGRRRRANPDGHRASRGREGRQAFPKRVDGRRGARVG